MKDYQFLMQFPLSCLARRLVLLVEICVIHVSVISVSDVITECA